MSRCPRLIGVILVLLAGCTHLPSTESLPASFDNRAVLVVIDDPRPARRRNALLGAGYQSRRNYDVDPLLSQSAEAIAESYDAIVEYQWPIASIDAHCFVVRADDAATLVGRLNADTRVRYAQLVNEFKSKGGNAADQSAEGDKGINQNDQAGLGQRIAIVDTKADLDHPDLPDERVSQWDLVGPDRGLPHERHGTAVLGLLAATPMNGIGIDGAAPLAEFGVFRGCWQLRSDSAEATCDTVSLSLALQTAHSWKPDVVNLSLTGPRDRLLEEIISAMLARGTVVVAAFDEDRNYNNRFPLKQRGVVYAYGISADEPSVADKDSIAIGARDALTLQPNAGYNVLSGHSMAAPVVSAHVAHFRASMPDKSVDALHEALRDLEIQSGTGANERDN